MYAGLRIETLVAPPVSTAKPPPTLHGGAIGIWDSTVIAISSTAPAYSLAASMAAMVLVVGFASPLVVALCFVPVLGIAVAFSYMNRADPNCGTCFSWVTSALGPRIGYMSGWASLAASQLAMIAASSLAGSYTLDFLGQLGWLSPARVNDQLYVAAVGSLWFAIVTYMVVVGITAAARFQRLLLGIEYLIVVAFSVYAIARAYGSAPVLGSQHISTAWFSPLHVGGLSGFAAGALVAVFFYWGWDTAASVNEETTDATENPGKAGILSMFALLGIFLLGVTAIQVTLSHDAITANSSDSLAIFAKTLVPKPWNYLVTLAVLTSAVANLQTTLLPSARTTLSMAREKVFPAFFATISPRLRTPWLGTLVIAALAFVGIAAGVKTPSVNAFLVNSVSQVGVLVAIYYGLTGLACAAFYRNALFDDLKTFLLAGVMALGGGVFMLFLGGYSVVTTIRDQGWGTEAPVLVALALGVPFLLMAQSSNPGHFQRKTTVYKPAALLV